MKTQSISLRCELYFKWGVDGMNKKIDWTMIKNVSTVDQKPLLQQWNGAKLTADFPITHRFFHFVYYSYIFLPHRHGIHRLK